MTKNNAIQRSDASALCHKDGPACGRIPYDAATCEACWRDKLAPKLTPHFVGRQHKVPTLAKALLLNSLFFVTFTLDYIVYYVN